jgi:GT2 family glycosyltransferase
VDNGSDERNARLLQEHFAGRTKLTLIFNDKNLGFTKGNNVLLKALVQPEQGFKYIALLNNDTAVDPNWLQRLVQCAEETGAGMVASKMVSYYDRSRMDNAGHFMLNTAEIIPIGHTEPAEAFVERFENMGACAGAALYSVDMLQDIGIFDEYFNTGYEDAELGVRAVVLGYKSMFEPGAVVYHKISRSVNKILNYNYLLKIQLDIFYSFFKLMPLPVLLVNLPSFVFKYGSVLLIDIVFLRIRFLKIMSHAIWLTLTRERKKILQSRREFFIKQRPVSSRTILKKQTFFLWFDIQRFWKYVVLRRPTTFERSV